MEKLLVFQSGAPGHGHSSRAAVRTASGTRAPSHCNMRKLRPHGRARVCAQGHTPPASTMLEELHRPLMLFRRLAAGEGPQVAALAGPGVLLAGIKAVLAGCQLADHVRATGTRLLPVTSDVVIVIGFLAHPAQAAVVLG